MDATFPEGNHLVVECAGGVRADVFSWRLHTHNTCVCVSTSSVSDFTSVSTPFTSPFLLLFYSVCDPLRKLGRQQQVKRRRRKTLFLGSMNRVKHLAALTHTQVSRRRGKKGPRGRWRVFGLVGFTTTTPQLKRRP